jgi:excisionase family DNA binding protein
LSADAGNRIADALPPFAGMCRRHGKEVAMEQIAVSIKETAKALGLGRTSIYAMIADGRLEAFKIGRRTLVRVESIRRLVAKRG